MYLCNSTYASGNPTNMTECAFVDQKNADELQDDGTKFRGLITKELLTGIGDMKYVLLITEMPAGKYYALKTYKATTANWTTHWEVSSDQGQSWGNTGDGYETELNVNWFYDGLATPTMFRYLFWANATDDIEVVVVHLIISTISNP